MTTDELMFFNTQPRALPLYRALPEIAAARPELIPRIRKALENADLAGYQDRMRPLLSKDIFSALSRIETTVPYIRLFVHQQISAALCK